MKLASVIEGGITGATTLSLIQEALHKIDSESPRPLLHKSGVIKKIKKSSGKKGSAKLYVTLAGELLAAASYFGLTGLGKKKNAVLRGGILGATAGLASAFLNNEKEENGQMHGLHNGTLPSENDENDETKKMLLNVLLYTAGGMLAGAAVKKVNKRTLKKIAKSLRKK
jgi:hypothetical protein